MRSLRDPVDASGHRPALASCLLGDGGMSYGPPWILMIGAIVAACGRESIDREALRDPASCAGCHPDHTREWAASMHAHASDDPVFIAMNRLGQRETGGALGDFCVRCHAPTAAALGATRDGLDLDELRSPQDTPAHASAHDPLVDGAALRSSDACGACHDVVLPGGLAIERTYAEWSTSLVAQPGRGLSCAACHMRGRDAPAALDGPTRRVHDHGMAGIDVALVPWPGALEQREAIARDLDGTLATRVCVEPAGSGLTVEVSLENLQAGHAFPSGTTHARRLWVELVAETAGVETWVRGRFEPGAIIHAGDDPEVWVLGSRFLDARGGEVQMAWEAAAIESELLEPAVTTDPTDPRFYHGRSQRWFVPGRPDRILLAVRIQPMGLDVLDVLIAAGDLDPAIRAAMPTFELAHARREWQAARDGFGCVPR